MKNLSIKINNRIAEIGIHMLSCGPLVLLIYINNKTQRHGMVLHALPKQPQYIGGGWLPGPTVLDRFVECNLFIFGWLDRPVSQVPANAKRSTSLASWKCK
jgi:hypothetical protein